MPVVMFKCSKCKAIRDSYDEAVRCEQSHLAAVSVREVEYRHGAYPLRVVLTFPDGKEVEYTASDP